eukprot:11861138-Prorocentrum_lima.AAC.1
MLAGHVKCNWEETLKSAHNQAEFKGYSMDSLLRKGVYPLSSGTWFMAQPSYESKPLNMFH